MPVSFISSVTLIRLCVCVRVRVRVCLCVCARARAHFCFFPFYVSLFLTHKHDEWKLCYRSYHSYSHCHPAASSIAAWLWARRYWYHRDIASEGMNRFCFQLKISFSWELTSRGVASAPLISYLSRFSLLHIICLSSPFSLPLPSRFC